MMPMEHMDDRIGNDRLFSTVHLFARMEGITEREDLPITRQALTYARDKHEGQFRKRSLLSDTPIPYIVHPLTIACHAHALGIREDEILAICLLHDVCEDCGIEPAELPFPEPVQHSVALLTRFDGQTEQAYYDGIRTDFKASIVKVLDRCNNVSHMATAFTRGKLIDYIRETEEHILPLMDKILQESEGCRDAVFLLQYQLCSVIETVKALLERTDRDWE